MKHLAAALEGHAARRPSAVALDDGSGRVVTYGALSDQVEQHAAALRDTDGNVLGLHGDNGIDWILIDLAAQRAGLSVVPLPTFFTEDQLQHVIATAAIDTVASDRQEWEGPDRELPGGRYRLLDMASPSTRSCHFGKVTFTSGTTGQPKGVCLANNHLDTVAFELARATASRSTDVHHCCLPLSILLENVAGVYRALIAGSRIVIPPLEKFGLKGSSDFDPERCWSSLATHRTSSAIVVPEMLKGLVTAARRPLEGLRYVGVGGARVSPQLLNHAADVGLPAYEGYGLSEFGSVVSLNTPDCHRIGTSGRPLSHVSVQLTATSEIAIRGPHYLGYLTPSGIVPPDTDDEGRVLTGDLGTLDADGFITVVGRTRNVIITSHGRNVSPEWIEAELTAHPHVLRAVVYGDGAPQPSAALVVATGRDIEAIVQATNRSLPDYARLSGCIVSRDGSFLDEVDDSESFAACFTNLLSNPEPNRWAFTVNS